MRHSLKCFWPSLIYQKIHLCKYTGGNYEIKKMSHGEGILIRQCLCLWVLNSGKTADLQEALTKVLNPSKAQRVSYMLVSWKCLGLNSHVMRHLWEVMRLFRSWSEVSVLLFFAPLRKLGQIHRFITVKSPNKMPGWAQLSSSLLFFEKKMQCKGLMAFKEWWEV